MVPVDFAFASITKTKHKTHTTRLFQGGEIQERGWVLYFYELYTCKTNEVS